MNHQRQDQFFFVGYGWQYFFGSWVGSLKNSVSFYLFTLDYGNIFGSQQRWECSTKTLCIQKLQTAINYNFCI
jgi:hypothetical protein